MTYFRTARFRGLALLITSLFPQPNPSLAYLYFRNTLRSTPHHIRRLWRWNSIIKQFVKQLITILDRCPRLLQVTISSCLPSFLLSHGPKASCSPKSSLVASHRLVNAICFLICNSILAGWMLLRRLGPLLFGRKSISLLCNEVIKD
jgi:hypothetical protein